MSGKATAEADERSEVIDEPSASSGRRAAAAKGTTSKASEFDGVPFEPAPGGSSTSDSAPAVSSGGTAAPVAASADDAAPASFLRRHRLPLALAVLALCLYVGSIVYILFGRGQIA